jgi:hypothetical protein
MKLKNGQTAEKNIFVTDGRKVGLLVAMGKTDDVEIGQLFEIGPAGGDLPSKLEVFDEWGDSRIKIGYRFSTVPLAELTPMVEQPAFVDAPAAPAPVPDPNPA